MTDYSEFYEPDYAELKARFLAIQKEVYDAESIVDMHTYATVIYPKFCKEMLKVVLSLQNAYSQEYGCSEEAIRGIKDDEFLNS